MHPITEDGKILKETITEGIGPQPKDGDKVKLNYIALIKDTGKEFDNTYKNGTPFKFIVGKSDIQVWSIGVKTLKVGEHAKFEVDSTYAYGEKGLENVVPPNTTIIIDVELLAIMDAFENVTDAINHATQLNDEAAVKFRAGDIDGALNLYEKAYGDIEDYFDDDAKDITIRTQRNLSLLYAKKGKWRMSLNCANNVLEKSKDDLKALARKIEALIQLDSLDEAKKNLQHALSISKNGQAFVALKGKLEEAEKAARLRENEQYAKMFGKSTKK